MIQKRIIAWCDRLCTVLGAFLFSQLPLYYNQYLHHLSGRLAELQWQANLISENAASVGKPLHEYIALFMQQAEPAIELQGRALEQLFARFSATQSSFYALSEAAVWSRPYSLVLYGQWDALLSTLHQFEPGLLLTPEGACYAALGLVVGSLCFRTLLYAVQQSYRLTKRLLSFCSPRGQKSPHNEITCREWTP